MVNLYNKSYMKAIDFKDLEELVGKSKEKPLLITFFRNTDNNSFLLESILNKVANEYKKKVSFFQCTVRSAETVQDLFPTIKKLPTSVLVAEGTEKDTFYGLLPKHKIEAKIEAVLAA